jgi:Primase C terminal 1 (PriCT-1)
LAFAFFAADGFVGVDLDDSLGAEGIVKAWARGIVERFSDTYMEISPSCRGIKIWVRGSLPANMAKVAVGDGGIELYDHARYFAFTGRAFHGAPLEVADHAADVRVMYEHLTAGKRTWQLQPLEGGRIPYGQQHSTLVSICGTLRARRVCNEAIEACLLAINAHQCERPGPPENISRIVRSSRRWGVA